MNRSFYVVLRRDIIGQPTRHSTNRMRRYLRAKLYSHIFFTFCSGGSISFFFFSFFLPFNCYIAIVWKYFLYYFPFNLIVKKEKKGRRKNGFVSTIFEFVSVLVYVYFSFTRDPLRLFSALFANGIDRTRWNSFNLRISVHRFLWRKLRLRYAGYPPMVIT